LAATLFSLFQDVPDAGRNWITKKILSMEERASNEMQFYGSGRESKCWPSLGEYFLLQHISCLYSVTDFNHGIVGPSLLLLCQYLSLAPIMTEGDMFSGLLGCSIALNYSAQSGNVVPEVVGFIKRMLITIRDRPTLSWIVENCVHSFEDSLSPALPCPWIATSWVQVPLELRPKVAMWIIDFVCSVLETVLSQQTEYVRCPEALESLVILLSALIGSANLSGLISQYHSSMAPLLRSLIDPDISRPALRWRKAVKTVTASLAPAFEENYTMRKNSELDEEKRTLKTLNRKVKREQKASMRELRRDSEFLDQEFFQAKQQVKTAKKDERARNYAWLEQEQGTFNQQVRMSKVPLTGGGTSSAKGKAGRSNKKK
jgi:nucleolar protein 14